MTDCKNCENKNWKQMYITAQQRFDATITKLTVGFVILLTITFICLVTTTFLVIKTQRFIDGFEYVEETETEYHIEQDNRGHNTVVLQDGSEVNINGSGSNNREEEEKILEKEEGNKVNSIIVNK
jgi:hypothetical protein